MIDQALAVVIDDVGDAPVVAFADHVGEDIAALAVVFDRDADHRRTSVLAGDRSDLADLDLGAGQHAVAKERIEEGTDRRIRRHGPGRAHQFLHLARE